MIHISNLTAAEDKAIADFEQENWDYFRVAGPDSASSEEEREKILEKTAAFLTVARTAAATPGATSKAELTKASLRKAFMLVGGTLVFVPGHEPASIKKDLGV